ncbi:DNA polymerase III, subunit gamma and tau [Halobacteriovorax marinus]|uniref:DNA polymerase III subunit gamma/tau n=1 Tax=Halobacteriovorax marinus TaxID=97084 RepID=A0A1Y5F6W6_9BACT|nr:DNA polymerase III, subunit gamma and tau [Halobacteriovorax marinus]
MSYQVLARKWRPKRFQDVIGQSHITKSLQNALSRDKLGHAYILTGTRGIGKTSVARIFAKAIRCEQNLEDSNSCGTCASCVDFDSTSSMNVVEIDGASNNSVDDIRDLIGNIQYLPTSGKYKIYIIDEVHMLSTSAFNALLKTLEEPPAHAIFILATTEPEKLLGTVLSRCQRFDFRNATVVDLTIHLKKIAETENINFQDDSIIKQICAQGKGSVRDTLSLLDQVLSFSEDNIVNEESVAFALGLAKTSAVVDLVTYILNGQKNEASKLFNTLLSENVSVKNICHSLLDEIYLFISQIDNRANIEKRWPSVDVDSLAPGEVFWVYESISKDVTWTLSSLSPEKSTEIAIQKIALRNTFFSAQELPKKKVLTEDIESVVEVAPEAKVESEPEAASEPIQEIEIQVEPIQEIKEVVTEVDQPDFSKLAEVLAKDPVVVPAEVVDEQKSEKATQELLKEKSVEELPRDWDGFLAYLFKVSPAAASNLEQGNILSPLSYNGDSVFIEIGFPESSGVFLEYLNEADSFAKLEQQVSSFFNVEIEKINLQLEMVEEEKAIESDFKSKAQIKQFEEEKVEAGKKEELLANPLIKQAEEIFNSKIDKVIITKNIK